MLSGRSFHSVAAAFISDNSPYMDKITHIIKKLKIMRANDNK